MHPCDNITLFYVKHSVDTVWSIKIIGEFKSTANVTHDYGCKSYIRIKLFAGSLSRKVQKKKTAIFFHEAIVYPFMNFRINKSSFEISSKNFVDILNVLVYIIVEYFLIFFRFSSYSKYIAIYSILYQYILFWWIVEWFLTDFDIMFSEC